MYERKMINKIIEHSEAQTKIILEGPYSSNRKKDKVLSDCLIGKLAEYYLCVKFPGSKMSFYLSKYGDSGSDLRIKNRDVSVKAVPFGSRWFQYYNKTFKFDGFIVVKMPYDRYGRYSSLDPIRLLEGVNHSDFITTQQFLDKADWKPKGSPLGKTTTKISAYWYSICDLPFYS